MSVTLNIDNFGAANIKDKLITTADTAAATTSIPVVNSSGISANDFLLYGQLGTEYGEKVQAAASGQTPDATHVVLASPGTTLAHKQFEPFWLLFGDKVNVYRAANVDGNIPADNTFSLLATVAINMNESYTQYNDSSGSNAYWYKFTYFNSVTNAESALADSITARGGGYDVYCSLESIRREAGLLNNEFITDAMIDSARYTAQFEIDGELQGLYSVPFQAPINPTIAELTRKLAAAKLLMTDYGPMASGNSKDGQQKLTDYERIMTRINNKTAVLTDVNGNELAISGAGGIKAWPNDTTATTDGSSGGSTRNFRMSDRY